MIIDTQPAAGGRPVRAERSDRRDVWSRATAAVTVLMLAWVIAACGESDSTATSPSTNGSNTSSSQAETTLPARELALEGTDNTRDVGGYTTSSGKTVQWGAVFRSDSLDELTSTDRATLDDEDIGTVVDFRGKKEIHQDGADRVPESSHIVHVPMIGTQSYKLSQMINTALDSDDADIIEDRLGNGTIASRNEEIYDELLNSHESLEGYAKTLRIIAESDHAVLYNCTSGKDRTGVMTALLLGVLGVPDQTITKDFLLSNDYNAHLNEQTYQHLDKLGSDPDLIRPLTEQRPSDIKPLLDAVDQHGGWDQFARQELGLSKTTLTQLRTKLLTK